MQCHQTSKIFLRYWWSSGQITSLLLRCHLVIRWPMGKSICHGKSTELVGHNFLQSCGLYTSTDSRTMIDSPFWHLPLWKLGDPPADSFRLGARNRESCIVHADKILAELPWWWSGKCAGLEVLGSSPFFFFLLRNFLSSASSYCIWVLELVH